MMDLTAAPTTIRVSSTLNRDARQWGKKHLIDGSDETCWNSDQGKQDPSRWQFTAAPPFVKSMMLAQQVETYSAAF